MKAKIILLLAVIFFFQNPIYAEANAGDRIIGATIKSVVKLVVATTNIEKVKKKLINKLEKIEDKEFRIRYTNFYGLIKDLPQDIKDTYRVTPRMTREQMIKNIKSVDKKTVYKIINRIPDKMVAGLFKQYLREIRQGRKT